MADAAAATERLSTPSASAERSPPRPSSTASPLSSFLAGLAGGSASTILLYPLDLIKVRMQVDERRRGSVLNSAASTDARVAATPAGCTPKAAADAPRTICTTVKGVIRHEGYLGLYRGLTPAIIGSAASWGGFFILYEETKRRMLARKQARLSSNVHAPSENGGESYDPARDMHVDEEIDINTNPQTLEGSIQPQARLGPVEHFSASCLAGACMVALTNPLWLIKTRLQLQNSKLQQQLSQPQAKAAAQLKPAYRGLSHAAYTIVKEEGVLALYKGSVPALMLVSHGGIQFVTYEFLKGHFAAYTNNGGAKKSSGRSKGTIGERLRDSVGYLVMGAASKFVASTTTYPLQVIKARLQQRSQAIEVSEKTGEIVVTKREYSGVVDCVRKIWRNEGINGFFKGCVTNAIRVAPSAAITFVTYETVLDLLTENE
ncbi:hypothetical protein ACHAXT_012226 [Thalassiosira profunda]